MPLKVVLLLALGMTLGLLFPRNSLVRTLYLSGTYFPRFIVTLAALRVFHLLTAVTAKLIPHHKDRAGTLFVRVVGHDRDCRVVRGHDRILQGSDTALVEADPFLLWNGLANRFWAGGSYDTLAVNVISAEEDLGLSREISEVSIVFGTVLNKNCTTMSVLIVTVIVAKLLSIPISLFEIALLVPPVAILGMESPGIPGGAGYFMSPIIAVLLHVPNPALWVTTFVSVYSGLIPMFSTAGNTTDDGVVGAILEDRLQNTHAGERTKPREGKLVPASAWEGSRLSEETN
jgi:Na+/H+-dicarboxylate symporter